MGIQGLLPFLKKIHSPVNISQYSGCTVAIDAYCWLHKGAFSCADKLAMGEKTDQYVYYCMKYVNYLLSKDIKPILVFDGQHLPSKREVEKSRRERREINRKKAAQFLREGKRAEARDCFQKCVDITPEMALQLMKACRARGVDCIVAPYEADAQLAYLNKAGIAQIVITEDSDLLLFGCDKIMFKMDFFGNGMMIDSSRLNEVIDMRENYTFEKFRYMCILSGCDYLASLPGIGLAKACKVFKTARQPDLKLVLKKIPSYLNTKTTVSAEYVEGFIQANNTFLYQLAFDPIQRKLVPLTPYPPGTDIQDLRYAGPYIPAEKAFQIALGNWNIYSNEIMSDFDPDNSQPSQQRSNKKQNFLSHLSIWDKKYRPAGNIRALKEVQVKSVEGRQSTAGKERVIDSKLLKNLPLKRSREDEELEDKKTEEAITDTYCEQSANKKQKVLEEEESDDNSESETEMIIDRNTTQPEKIDKKKLWRVMQQEDKENTSQASVSECTPRRNKFAVSPQSLKKERFDINAVVETTSVKTEVKSRFFKTQSKLALKKLSKADTYDMKCESTPPSEEFELSSENGSCEDSTISQDDIHIPEDKVQNSSQKLNKNSPSAFTWSRFKFSKQMRRDCENQVEERTLQSPGNRKLNQPFKKIIVSRKADLYEDEQSDMSAEIMNENEDSPHVGDDEIPSSYSQERESGYFSASGTDVTSVADDSQCREEGRFHRTSASVLTVDLTDKEDEDAGKFGEWKFSSQKNMINCSTLSTEDAGSIAITAPTVRTPTRAASACRVPGLSRGKGKISSLTKQNSMPSDKQHNIKSMFARFAHKSKSVVDKIAH